jgi:hypothetical protein
MNANRDRLRAFSLSLGLHVAIACLAWLAFAFSGGGSIASGSPGPIVVTLSGDGDGVERARAAINATQERLRRAAPQPHASSGAQHVAVGEAEFQSMVEAAVLDVTPSGPARTNAAIPDLPAEVFTPVAEGSHGEGDAADQAHGVVAVGSGAAATLGVDTLLEARYMAALRASAQGGWDSGTAPAGVPCQVRFAQAAGGHVVSVEFLACPFGPQEKGAVKAALLSASLPYAGFEGIFASHQQQTLVFCHPEGSCTGQ